MVSVNPKILLWPKKNFTENEILIVKLAHPRTSKSANFLLNSNCELQEILKVEDGHRSWFLENSVVSDECAMRICTPIDKLFLLLPYLEKSKNFSPLQDLITDENFPANHDIFDENMAIGKIADSKKAAGLTVYKFNKDKTLEWLREKLHRVVSVLRDKGLDVSQGNFSANYKNQNTTQSEDDYKRFAHGIISEYISSHLSQELLKACGLDEVKENGNTPVKRQAEENEDSKSKRTKCSTTEEPTEDYSKSGTLPKANGKTNTGKLTSAQKKLMNSSKKGMKNIDSFFGKPKK